MSKSNNEYTIKDFKEIYLIQRENEKLAEKSLDSVEHSIQRFEDFLESKDLTVYDFDKESDIVVDIEGKKSTHKGTENNLYDYFIMWMINEAGYASSTISTTTGYFNSFIEFLYKEEHITYEAHKHTSVSDYISHSDTEQRKRWSEDYVSITPEQHKIVRANVPPPVFRNKLICDILMTTGMRRSELTELKLSNVDLTQNKIDVPAVKGSDKTRPVFIPDKIKTNLKIWIEAKRDAYYNSDSEYVFITNDSRSTGGLSPKRVSKIVQIGASALDDQDSYEDKRGRVKNKYKAHSYRNGFADHFINESSSDGGTDEDANIYVLKEILGHSSITQTEKYISKSDETMIKDQMDKYSPDV